MTTFKFESIMFLKASRTLWNAVDVAQVIAMQRDDSREAADSRRIRNKVTARSTVCTMIFLVFPIC